MLDPVITTVIIGPGEVKFSIHKALLFDVADYFHAAYRSGLQESKEDVFRFPDIDVAVFQSFSLWLYTGKIHLKVDDDGIPIELYTSRNADPLYCSDSESSYEPDSDDEDEDARSDIPEVEEEDDNEEADEDNGISESGDEDAKRASTHTNSKLFELGLMQTRSRGKNGRTQVLCKSLIRIRLKLYPISKQVITAGEHARSAKSANEFWIKRDQCWMRILTSKRNPIIPMYSPDSSTSTFWPTDSRSASSAI